VLRGVLFCGICNRRMQGSWNNNQTYYRCTFPAEYALANRIQHPRAVYLREAEFLHELDTWLSSMLDPAHLPTTLHDLTTAQRDEPAPEITALHEDIRAAAQNLAQYRATLDAGGDPAIVGPWITETQARKLAAEARLRALEGTRPRQDHGRMTKEEITAIVDTITSLMTVIRNADPHDKSELYSQLGLHLTYNPGPRTVTARAELANTCTKGSCPRGDLNPHALLGH